MKKNVIIVAVCGGVFEREMLSFLNANESFSVVDIESFNKSPFEPEPIIIKNVIAEIKPLVYYERKPSKFIEKPKNNFKK